MKLTLIKKQKKTIMVDRKETIEELNDILEKV